MVCGIHEISASTTTTENPPVDDMVYILEGEMEIMSEGALTKLAVGDFAYFRAGIPRNYCRAQKGQAAVRHVSEHELEIIAWERWSRVEPGVGPRQVIVLTISGIGSLAVQLDQCAEWVVVVRPARWTSFTAPPPVHRNDNITSIPNLENTTNCQLLP